LGLSLKSFIGLMVFSLGLSAAVASQDWEHWKTSDSSSVRAIDHESWQRFLSVYLDTNGADGVHRLRYAQVAPADRAMLEGYLKAMQAVRVTALNRREQLAFWINLYNAETVALVLARYPARSIRDLGIAGPDGKLISPFDAEVLRVEGRALSLNEIENRILRPLWADGRIHFALNCGSLGCPNLAARPYAPATMDAMLDQGARTFINAPRGIEVKGDTVKMSALFEWYREDFGKSDSAVLQFIRGYADPGNRKRLPDKPGEIRYQYDWKLNDRRDSGLTKPGTLGRPK
jgi:hypothetical protein